MVPDTRRSGWGQNVFHGNETRSVDVCIHVVEAAEVSFTWMVGWFTAEVTLNSSSAHGPWDLHVSWHLQSVALRWSTEIGLLLLHSSVAPDEGCCLPKLLSVTWPMPVSLPDSPWLTGPLPNRQAALTLAVRCCPDPFRCVSNRVTCPGHHLCTFHHTQGVVDVSHWRLWGCP